MGRSIVHSHKPTGRFLQVFLCLSFLTFAQVSFAQSIAITMKSGLVVEGLSGSIDKISVTLEAPDPYGKKQIVLMDDGLARRYVSLRDLSLIHI